MNVQLARAIGFEAFGGSAYGECLVAAEATHGSDRDTWAASWSAAADRLQTMAQTAEADGNVASAYGRYLRAYNYYRSAEFFINPRMPEKSAMFRKSQTSFETAMKLAPHPVQKVHVSYEDTQLPVFYWRVDDQEKPGPTVILHGGGDASGEEMYLMGGVAALKRGYNVISFEGPGQRGFLYDNPGHPYRPDYEKAITPVIDWAVRQPTVNADQVVLSAISFGGYTGSRAAAFDHRIAAFVANAPMTDFYRLLLSGFQRLTGQKVEEKGLAETLTQLYDDGVAGIQFAVDQLYWILGTKTLPSTFSRMKEFRLAGVEKNIQCPVLCLYAEAEGQEGQRQFDEFVSNLSAPYDVYKFDELSGGNAHCMLNNYVLLYEVKYDWLDKTLGRRSSVNL